LFHYLLLPYVLFVFHTCSFVNSTACDDTEKILLTFYRQRQAVDSFLSSNGTVSRTIYIRIFLLASLDIFVTLPSGITAIVCLTVAQSFEFNFDGDRFPFYSGWKLNHTDWEPFSVPFSRLVSIGSWEVASLYVALWQPVFVGFAVVALFGFTKEARWSYWGTFVAAAKLLGWHSSIARDEGARLEMRSIVFAARPGDELSGQR
jgi:hypothetical protein